jgi:DNA-binding CsgD family transcriptional regulator
VPALRPGGPGADGMQIRLRGDAPEPGAVGFFIESDREPDDSVRQYAAAQLAGWLDNEVRLFPRTRATGLASTRDEKLAEIAGVAADAWGSLQPDEPFWLPNTFVRSFDERRKKKSLAGRGGSLMDGLPDLNSGVEDPALHGTEEEYIEAFDLALFEEAENYRRQLSAFVEKAQLSEREAAVIERDRRGEETAQIAAALGITKNQVRVHRDRAIKKMRKAAGL